MNINEMTPFNPTEKGGVLGSGTAAKNKRLLIYWILGLLTVAVIATIFIRGG